MSEWIYLALIGLSAGVLSGMLGVGGGLVIVPLLILVTKMDIHQAVGTSLAVIVPTALVGALRHHAAGHVAWKYVLMLALFAALGGFFGAQWATAMPSGTLRKVFAVFMVVIAARMLVSH